MARLLPLVARTTNSHLKANSEHQLVLDGSMSFDPGNENVIPTFQWTCQKVKDGGGCYVVESGERFENALADQLDNSIFKFDPKSLPPDT